MSVLRRMKVSQAIGLVGLLPVAMALVLIGLLVNTLLQELQLGQRAQDMVKLSQYLDGVAHNHAVERGLSAGFLGSKGTSGKEAMLKQRGVADEAAAKLRGLTASDFSQITQDELTKRIQPVLKLLEQKNAVRSKIDQLSPANGAFAYYSTLNATALGSIQYLITDISDAEMSRLLESRLSLLWMKERIGQYRGALNGVFAAKTLSEKRFTEILAFLNDETKWQQDFNAQASASSKSEFDAVVGSADWKTVDQHVATFKQSNDLSNVNGPDNWFALATKRIGLVKGVADNIGVRVSTAAEERVQASEQRIILLLVIYLVVTLPVLWLIRHVIKSVASRVELIHGVLRSISKDRDLSHDIPNTSEDEIGEIITGLNHHLTHLSKSFQMLSSLSEQSRESMQSLFGRAQTALAESKDQFNRTDQIATAVEEMSLTSNTISEDMVSVSKETEQIQQQGAQGRARMDNILGSIQGLSREVEGGFGAVQQVTDQTEQISSILQTIESIAEQTNLLALNAAIEAARAGEQGRGFAVVADEVRSLAQRTQDSTEEIRTMIESLVRSGQSALTSMDKCSKMATDTSDVVNQNVEMIQALFASIDSINQTIERVATASEEQSQVAEDINQNVQTVNDRSHHILDAVSDTETGTEQAMERFDQVLKEISSYRIR